MLTDLSVLSVKRTQNANNEEEGPSDVPSLVLDETTKQVKSGTFPKLLEYLYDPQVDSTLSTCFCFKFVLTEYRQSVHCDVSVDIQSIHKFYDPAAESKGEICEPHGARRR